MSKKRITDSIQNRILWDKILLKADVHTEAFQDVTVITLSSHYKDIVTQRVVDEAPSMGNETVDEYLARIEKEVRERMDDGKHGVREFVKVDEDMSVTICVDHNFIDDDIIFDTLNILNEINIEPDTYVEFGEKKTFKFNEAPRLHS